MSNGFTDIKKTTVETVLAWVGLQPEMLNEQSDLPKMLAPFCKRLEQGEPQDQLKSEVDTIFNNPTGQMMLQMAGASAMEFESLAKESAAQVAHTMQARARLVFNHELGRQLSEAVKADTEKHQAARSEWLKIQIDQMLQQRLGTTVEVLPNSENGKALPTPPKKDRGKTASTHSNPT